MAIFKDGKEHKTLAQAEVAKTPHVPAVTPGTAASYATYTDFLQRYQAKEVLQISQAKVPNPDKPDKRRVELALLDASDLIDSYLRSRYAKGLTALHSSPPPTLIRHTCAIARYHLAQNKATEQQRALFDDAIDWCELVLKDGQGLVTGAGETIAQISAVVNEEGAEYTAEAYSHNCPRSYFSQERFARQGAALRNHTRGGGGARFPGF